MSRRRVHRGYHLFGLPLLIAFVCVCGCGQQAANLNSQGMTNLNNGNYRAAIDLFQKAADSAPEVFPIRYNLAMAYHMAGEPEKAVQSLAKGLSFADDSDEHRSTLALLQIEAEENQAAAETLTELIESNPDQGQLYLLRGVAYLKAGFNDEAAEDFDKAIELNPYDYRAMIAKASAIKEGSPDDALETLNQAAKVAEDMADSEVKATIQWNLANILIRMGLLERAAQHLERARTFAPQDESFIKALAVVYQNLGNYSKAHQVYFLLPAEQYEDAESHLFLARLYYNQKDYTRALAEARAAEEIDRENIEIVNLQGMIFARRGQIIPAVREFERSLQTNPEQPEIRKIVEALKVRR